MPGFIGDDQVRRIKEAVDLVQLMGEYASLKKSGSNFSCCCPFHQERTPSMHIYVDQQTYHCFGCGAHGDIITLVREKEHLEFTDALELLARRAGIEIAYQSGGNQLAKGDRDQLADAVEMATKFYEKMLWESQEGAAAREYLARRGLSTEVCKRFRLGWSPGSGMLVEEARRQRMTTEQLIKTDLAVERNGRYVDRFFERVMFPISDRFGNPIAFSGRLLPEAERAAKEKGIGVGKYVNNTDTPLYHKGNIIFNLHRARGPSRDKGRLLVMEGPTDVMAADDAGFSECVAVLGTALTPEHAKQLGTLVGGSGRLILLFDGDKAGQTNSLKAVRTCLAAGVPSWVAVIPDEMDPAELLKEDAALAAAGGGGVAAFERVLDAARGDLDHLLRAVAPRPYELDHRALLAVADQILDCLRPLKDRELLDLYLRDAANYLNLDRQRLERRLAGGGVAEAVADPGALTPDLGAEQEVILHILIRCQELRGRAFDQLGLEANHFPAAWAPLVDRLVLEPDSDDSALLLLAEGEGGAALRPALFRWVTTDLVGRVPAIGDPGQQLTAAVHMLRRGRLRDELHRLGLAIAEAEKARDFTTVGKLVGERLNLTRDLKDVEGQSGFGGESS